MDQVFSVDFMVRDYELDKYGVVNNAVYQNYLEHARHQFLHQVGIDPAAVARTGKALALSEINIRYRSPLRSRERFRVEISIEKVRAARMVLLQRILAGEEERLVLQARAEAVFLNEQGRPVRVPAEHVAAFAPYLKSDC